MTISDRVRVKNVEILSDDYYLLKKTTFEYRRANGEWQAQARETYDRGNCATVLPYNLAQRTVVESGGEIYAVKVEPLGDGRGALH